MFILSILWSGLLPSFLFFLKAFLVLNAVTHLHLSIALGLFIVLFQVTLFYLQVCYVTDQALKVRSPFLRQLGKPLFTGSNDARYVYTYYLWGFFFF